MRQAPLLFVGLLAVFGCRGQGAQSLAEKSFTFTPLPISTKTQISCKAIASLNIGQTAIAAITGNRADENRLTASILDGTDRVSIRIEPDYLVFLSKASFETGRSEGSSFR